VFTTMPKTLLTKLPPASDLDLLEPADIRDPIGEEIERTRESKLRAWQGTAVLLAGLLAICVPTLIHLANKTAHPITRWIRIDPMGLAQTIQYNDLNYTPQTVEVKRYLLHWVQSSYARQQETVLTTYPERFYFMASDLVSSTQAKDLQDQTIAAVKAGRIPGNTLKDVSVVFRSFVTKGSTAKGTADIYFTKVFGGATPQHFETAVTFEVDPNIFEDQARLAAVAPEFKNDLQQQNPIGLFISYMDEQALP
jgi:hypothetical protein